MSIDTTAADRTPMSQRERDILKVMHTVVAEERTQAEAARLLRLSVRQVRRLQRRREDQGDQAVVPRLRGQPSNHRLAPQLRPPVLSAYRRP
jgi:Helix-turn-helix domain